MQRQYVLFKFIAHLPGLLVVFDGESFDLVEAHLYFVTYERNIYIKVLLHLSLRFSQYIRVVEVESHELADVRVQLVLFLLQLITLFLSTYVLACFNKFSLTHITTKAQRLHHLLVNLINRLVDRAFRKRLCL